MLKALFPGWKIGILAIVSIIIVVLFFSLKDAKKDIKVVKAEATAVVAIKDGVIAHNLVENKKLEDINVDNAKAVVVAKKVEEKIKETVNKVDVSTSKVTKAGTALSIETAAKVDNTKYISEESVAVLQKLIDEMEPMIYPSGDETVGQSSPEQVDVNTN